MTFIEGDSLIHRLDPRAKILVGFAFSIFIAVSRTFPVLWATLLVAFLLAVTARLSTGAVLKRILGLNMFMLLLWIILPLTTSGPALCVIGPLSIGREGVLLSAMITLKGNGIVIAYTALLSTTEAAVLGHAFSHLHVPDKLAHLFLFTIRYIDVLHHEYARLRIAMKTRCFHPRVNMHTYRAFAYLVGMLLTRSLDRSERVIAAMKCRGFRGKFYVVDHFAVTQREVIFGTVSFLVLLALALAELS